MDNIQEILLFPVRDADARKQFLFTSLVVLAGFVIPILPFLLLMGYTAKIMRQIIEDHKNPSMPEWQGSDWSAMLMDGLRLYGAQILLTLPLMIFMGCGFISMFGGSMTMAIASEERINELMPAGILFVLLGIGFIMIFSVLSLPYSIIISPAGPHVVAQHSFEAAFQFKEWWAVFRKAIVQFIMGYAIVMALSFALFFVLQLAMMTIVLICIVPFLMVPYTAYISLLTNTMYAQAYRIGKEALETEHATA